MHLKCPSVMEKLNQVLVTKELESNKKLWGLTSTAGASKQVAFRVPRRRQSLLIPD